MSPVSEPTLVLLHLVTALSSAFNAIYFLGYRSQVWRRRIGALALALTSLAMMGESLYLALSWGDGASVPAFRPGYWLVAGLLAGLGSLLITSLIIRQFLGGGHDRKK